MLKYVGGLAFLKRGFHVEGPTRVGTGYRAFVGSLTSSCEVFVFLAPDGGVEVDYLFERYGQRGMARFTLVGIHRKTSIWKLAQAVRAECGHSDRGLSFILTALVNRGSWCTYGKIKALEDVSSQLEA